MRRNAAGLLVLMLAGGGAACTSSKTTTVSRTTVPSDASTSSSPLGTATVTSETAGATTTSLGSTCAPKSDETPKQSSSGTHGTFTALRVAAPTACIDRVVFEMREQSPASLQYTVERADPPFTEDGSGKTVTVAGKAYVKVVMRDVSGYDFSANRPAYTGSRTVTPPAGVHRIVQLKETGDFEGVVNWVIGLDARHPFSVTVLSNPIRLVVDFAG